MTQSRLGSVVAVGGGISRMQAALDLANSGYYVYLVERSSPIGGVMAQLDKTFLTKEEIWGLPLTFDKSNRTFGWF